MLQHGVKPSLCRVWYSRMIVLVPLELTEYDYEYNNDPRNTLHAAGPLAHRRGYSGRRLLTQVSPVALVFTTPALHALGLSAEPYQVSSVIQWQVFHTPILLACKQSSTTTSPRWWCASTA